MVIENSIVSTYRNRPDSIKCFLGSFVYASSRVDKDSCEIIIVELSSAGGAEKIINSYRGKINIPITLYNIPHNGTFCKSKAINYGVKRASKEYITHIDIDSIVPPTFLIDTQQFYENSDMHDMKLCYRVRFLNSLLTNRFSKHGIRREKEILLLARKYSNSRLARERYTEKEIIVPHKAKFDPRLAQGQALGNSHFTMRKDDYVAIGGFDEKMSGWGCEDLDFNWRFFKKFRKGYLRPDPQYTIFSLNHTMRWGDKLWRHRSNMEKNKRLYERNKSKKIISLPIDRMWGEF